jgi:hypothetical protein
MASFSSHFLNYSIVPELSVGNNKMILCDEQTLTKICAEAKEFDNLALIVNCHEAGCSSNKYKIGSCSSKKKP